ncbi:NAD(+)--rifampin ADP-ribosyltransferase [Undibacterium sp. Ji42W]|uniref:NAD(+)--rifampin ADP-ribosyltransferase n=1 Tax=Undibacterium sp. Ji42W TaxID=3413039 RepID=UPI003BF1C424
MPCAAWNLHFPKQIILDLTDKKVPGNPTKSYHSREALKVVGEVKDWQGHPPEVLKAMKDHVEQLRRQGVEAIDD